MTKKLTWAVAVTTVPERRERLLPLTLNALQRGGWEREEIRLCVDGCQDPTLYGMMGHDATLRYPRLHGRPGQVNGGNVSGNWILSLWELWIRYPAAQRYMICQDDVTCVTHLRQYLDGCPWPKQGYFNLYSDGWSERVIRGKPVPSWVRGKTFRNVDGTDNDWPVGEHKGFQMGRGALALVFDKDAVVALLSRKCLVLKTQDPINGWHRVDGIIVTAMNESGFSEWVHNPSLVQHHGLVSSIGNLPPPGTAPYQATTYPGDTHDASQWLR